MPTTGPGPGEWRSAAGTGPEFILRLCLDLQIDALMLTLAEAARDAAARGAAPATRFPLGPMPAGAGSVPWRNWLEEDVERTYALAADVVGRGGTLPAVLGPAGLRRSSQQVLDDLSAHYDVIRGLLVNVRRDLAVHHRVDGSGEPWVDQVLEHYRQRLESLRSQGSASADAVPSGVPEKFLPGELLG